MNNLNKKTKDKVKTSITTIEKEKYFLVSLIDNDADEWPEAIETLISAVEELNLLAESL